MQQEHTGVVDESLTFSGHSTAVSRFLARCPQPIFVLFVGAAGFMTYFSMYAFRKPFTAGIYDDEIFGLNAKSVFVISQLVGYALSKYLGIWICSTVPPKRRIHLLFILIVVAELALVAAALLPLKMKPIAFFANGMPLGMIWGGVVLFLEGRRSSDILISMLLASYVFASAIVRDVGLFVMKYMGVSTYWMPMTTGLLFLPVFLLALWMLSQIPMPDNQDKVVRRERTPMTMRQVASFLKNFAPGFLLVITFYFFSTAFRNIREDFGANVLKQLGLLDTDWIFTKVDIVAGLGLFVALSLLYFLPPRRWGVIPNLVMLLTGSIMVGVVTLLFDVEAISGLTWMIIVAVAAFLMYLPADTLFYDRLIARYRIRGTAVFMACVMDALGYTGTVCIVLYQEFTSEPGVGILPFFRWFCYCMAIGGSVLIILAAVFFVWKARNTDFDEIRAASKKE